MRRHRERTLYALHGVTEGARRLNALLGCLGLGWRIEHPDFDFYDDVRLADGTPAAVAFWDNAPPVLVEHFSRRAGYLEALRALLRDPSHEPYARIYLEKRIVLELGDSVRAVLTAGWLARDRLGPGTTPVLATEETWLRGELAAFAASQGVEIRPLLRAGAGRGLRRGLRFIGLLFHSACSMPALRLRRRSALRGSAGPRIAVEMYHNGIRSEGPYNSDLFWWRRGAFPDGTVLAYFRHPADLLTKERAAELQGRGIAWVDRGELGQLMSGWPRGAGRGKVPPRSADLARFLRPYLVDFYREFDRWVRFCRRTGARIHVSTSDHFPESEALHAAFREAGGLSVGIQRSIERESCFFRRTAIDLHLGFCRASARREAENGSAVARFIIVGYPFDGSFDEARRRGAALRARLAESGARFVVCYLDQNVGIHRRRMGGTRGIERDHRFLLKKMRTDPELGLILKPKRPGTLRKRLGPLWSELQHWIGTGRCVLLSGGGVDETYLPSVGACASDVAVNILMGGTAGLEGALVGVPTLLLGHRMERGIFSRLPPGEVVFEEWAELWEAVERLRRGGARGGRTGNWGPILEDLVQQRDGKAAVRIGQVLLGLWEGLSGGGSPEEVWRAVGQRHTERWGVGWVAEISDGSERWLRDEEPFPDRTKAVSATA